MYDRELEEEEEEEEGEDDQLELHRLPDLLYRNAPQLLQYTAALHYNSEDGDDTEEELEIQRERRGELRLDSNIGMLKKIGIILFFSLEDFRPGETDHFCLQCALTVRLGTTAVRAVRTV